MNLQPCRQAHFFAALHRQFCQVDQQIVSICVYHDRVQFSSGQRVDQRIENGDRVLHCAARKDGAKSLRCLIKAEIVMLAHQRLPAAFDDGVDANGQLIRVWRHFLIAGVLVMQNIGLGPFLLCHHFPQATDEAYAVRNGNAAISVMHQWAQQACRLTRSHTGANNNDALQLLHVLQNFIRHHGCFKAFIRDVLGTLVRVGDPLAKGTGCLGSTAFAVQAACDVVFNRGAIDAFQSHITQHDAEHVKQIRRAIRYRAGQHANIHRVQQFFSKRPAVVTFSRFQLV
ncbi:Uncharacterised protein [Klebsiella pneumoniae]|nr:Uncharacterised protein [Klebsiella pneumoniae]